MLQSQPQTPVTRGRIIPAEPPTAFWYLERHLADLLFTIPAPEPLTSEWLDEMRKTTHAKVGRAVSSVDHYSPNEQLRGKIHKASTKALQLATLLRESPSLSSIPRREWTVPSEGQLFDDLAKLQHEFETLGNTDNWSQAGGKWLLNPDQEAAGETPAVATGQPSAIPSRWIPIILDLQDRFTSDEGRFSEGEFSKKHSHIEGCSPCLAVLESLGVIGEKKFANLAEETGPLSAVLPSYDDVREIHPTIMTHPDLKGLATQGANPAKDAKGGEEDWSKAYPMKAWIIVFNSAGSLGEKSDRTFRDWVKEQVNQGNASRESPKAPVRFKVSVLKRLNVDPPDVK